jgi:hypothetical protein
VPSSWAHGIPKHHSQDGAEVSTAEARRSPCAAALVALGVSIIAVAGCVGRLALNPTVSGVENCTPRKSG